ncbi:hypothetical protein [Methanobacterium sp.]|jgi:hypothetical protein|uniref:hypothetical protein n=1 Tax=Methanobacterium sp. TaxID=2164 RepID=UPI0031591C1D
MFYGDFMLEVKVLEFGYSVEHQKHFIKLNIMGMEEEKKDKILPMIANIPLGNIKRFVVESDDEKGLKILEYFPENEYPFNNGVPTGEEIKAVEEMVKGFMIQ